MYSCKAHATTAVCPACGRADGRRSPHRCRATEQGAARLSRPPGSTRRLASTGCSTTPRGRRPRRSRDFTQQEPNLGQPATERTEVRILYDSRNIYIGVHAYQIGRRHDRCRAPGGGAAPDAGAHAHHSDGVVATEMRRDSDRLFDEDNFQVILDTFKDSRNGYMFVTTPLGAKLEQQIFDEGEGGGRGTTSNVNRNWDGVWDSAATDHRRRLDGRDRHPDQHRSASSRATSRPGASISCATSAARTSSPTGRRFRAPTALTRVSLAGELRGLQNLSLGTGPEAEAVRGRPACANRELSATNQNTDVGARRRVSTRATASRPASTSTSPSTPTSRRWKWTSSRST